MCAMVRSLRCAASPSHSTAARSSASSARTARGSRRRAPRHPRPWSRRAARGTTRAADGGAGGPLPRHVQRHVAAHARARGRRRHDNHGRRLLRMIAAVLGIDWRTLADAFALGSIYALMAIGIGLVFGVLRLVNFAYGQLVMAGAF